MLVQETFARVREQAGRVLVGQTEALDHLLIALIAGGNVLLEGVPGTAKTLLAKTLALLVRAEFRRVQFTPDLMPSDIVGTSVFDPAEGRFHLRRGPIFTDVLLADEINRAPAKTQSALLEAMEERQVTIEGERYALGETFIAIATQNPVEYEGTYPLPEAQLDRFMFKLRLGYLPPEAEMEVLRRWASGFDARRLDLVGLEPVLDPGGIVACRREVAGVTVDDAVLTYITQIANETRRSPDLLLGVSPRASVALMLGARVLAALEGRGYVIPDDAKRLVEPVFRHRIILKPEAEIEGVDADAAIRRVLSRVEVPR